MAKNHRTMAAQIASAASTVRWTSLTPDQRAEATAAARRAFAEQWETLVDPTGELDPEERAQRVAEAKREHYAGLALKGAVVRRAKAEARKAATDA